MTRHAKEPKERSRLASLGIFMTGLVLFLAGTLLLVLGQSEPLAVQVLGLTVTSVVPALILMGLGLVVLFRSGRRVDGRGDHDPDSHLALPREFYDDERYEDSASDGDDHDDDDGGDD